MTSLIVVFPTREDAANMRRLLLRSGFSVAMTCTSGMRALQAADRLGSGIVVCGYRLRDMLYSELYENLPQSFHMVLLSSGRALPGTGQERISPVSMPVQVQELTQLIEELIRQAESARPRRRGQSMERSQREMKVISQAKALLMQRNGMTEEEAHRYLQKTSMESGVGLVETAGMILSLMR